MNAKLKNNQKPFFNQNMLKKIVLIMVILWSGLLILKSAQVFKPDLRWFAIFFDLKRFAPFNSSVFINHWLGTGKVLLVLIGMLLTALGLGSFLSEKLGLLGRGNQADTEDDLTAIKPLRELIISFGIGLAGMSLLTKILGFMQLYYSWLFLLFTIFGAGFGAFTLWKNWKKSNVFKEIFDSSFDKLDYAFMGITVIAIIFILINLNAPELFFDSLNNHLAVARHYLNHHGIVDIPTMFFSKMPFAIEMLYTWGLLLADERVCKMTHAFLGFLGAGMIYVTARKITSPKYALWAGLLYLTIPVLTINMMESGIDVGASFFAILAFNLLIDWFEKNSQNKMESNVKLTFATGMIIGFSLLAKYTTALILAPSVLLIYIILIKLKKYTWVQLTKTLIIMSFGVIIVLSPLLIKNTVLTGNPVYPFLHKLIPSKNLSPEKIKILKHEWREFGERTISQ